MKKNDPLPSVVSNPSPSLPPRPQQPPNGQHQVQARPQGHIPAHFCAGVLCEKQNGVWYVAGVTDKRFPQDVRLPGGTNKNAPWENVIKTLHRELGEELDVQIDDSSCKEVHTVDRNGHTQHFFVIGRWSGKVKVGLFKDTDGEELQIRWVTLIEFWRRCFRNHREGLQKAVVELGRAKAGTIEDNFVDQAVEAGIILR